MKEQLYFLDDKDNIVEELDLGMVFVGDSKTYEYKLWNNTGTNVINVKVWFDIQTDEIEILKQPDKLERDGKGIVSFKWTPNLKIKQGLRTKIFAKAIEVWS